MNLEDPSSPGGGGQQAPKKIEAYQCNLCPAVFGFKFNAKRHFQKLHPDDEYDGSKIANIKFKCYVCHFGLDTYGSLEAHFAQVHADHVLNPEKVFLGDTQTTAATFQSVKRMKTPSKRKRPAESSSRPPSASSSTGSIHQNNQQQMQGGAHRCHFCGYHLQSEAALANHMMLAHPDNGNNAMPPSYVGDVFCNSCNFRCDNPQSLELHMQTMHHVQPQAPENNDLARSPASYMHAYPPSGNHPQQPQLSDPYSDFKVEEDRQQYDQMHYQHHHQPYGHHHHHPPPPLQHPQPYDQGYHPQQQQQQQEGYHHYPPHHEYYPPNHHEQQPPGPGYGYYGYPPQQPHQPPPPPPPQMLSPPHPYQHLPPPLPPPPQQQHVPSQESSNHQYQQMAPQKLEADLDDDHKDAAAAAAANEALMGNTDLQSSQTATYSPYSQQPNIDSSSPRSNGGNNNIKQRRTNIGKMFQTHICYKCDSRLAKLDCIKMHFKNKHPETPLDLNKVMISRVVCYICATRKKEYAMLGRHFTVEHRGHEIDPYKIGMDEPTPFNLSAEEEAELAKFPIPQPPNHDQYNKTMMKKQQHKNTTTQNNESIDNESTMDSLMSEPAEEQVVKKPRRMPISAAFKNNKCLVCGKAFSRITTVKKHFLEHHSSEEFDKSKIEVTQLPCYLCTTLFTDSRHALRHFETNHPGVVFEVGKIRAPLGVEMTNGSEDIDESSQNLLLDENFKSIMKNDSDEDNGEDIEDEDEDDVDEDNSEDGKRHGFRCYLCNFWCSSLEAFQAHFAPGSKAHDHIISHSIICPLCKEHMETTDEMFDHMTKMHSSGKDSLASSNNKNCVESC